MQQIQCVAYDAPLEVSEQPDPQPGANDVIIDVSAAGVNYVDALIVSGRYQLKTPPPFTPGSEVAGTICALGADVRDWQIGDRVFAMTNAGYADRNQVAAAAVQRIPENMTDGQAASFVQSYCTAWFALHERGRLQPNETVLVLGAAGGVGAAAIDVAKAHGATVIAAASSQSRLAACQAIGADHLLNYGECSPDELKNQARELAGGGVDIVYDPVGGDLAAPCLRALGEDGRYLVVGFARGAIPTLPANQILLRNRSVIGVEWGGWVRNYPEQQQALLRNVVEHIATGHLHPPEPTTYAFGEAAAALDDLEHRRVHGKIVLLP